MQKLVFTLLAVASLSYSAAHADAVVEMEQRLKELYPATRITSVRESQIKGVYEVVMGRNVSYADESGRYMIFGHLYDMKEQRDLTAGVLDDINRIDIATLPPGDAIVTVRGKGERNLYVFSDPDCSFCRRLESDLARLDNVTIHTFLYPLEGLHPDAKQKAIAVWCSKEREAAWQALMTPNAKGSAAPATKIVMPCDNPVERNIQMGNRLGINGTPTLIFEDGQMVPGALPTAEIERRMAGAQDRRAKRARGG